MYINERGEVNYHGFIKAVRESQGVRTEAACKGLCTTSGWNRFENGNRMAEKLMGDRIVSRLGISGEKYEDYLKQSEYNRWKHRMRIVQAIKDKSLEYAKEELISYETLYKHNSINHQFIYTMRYMIRTLEGAPEDELLQLVKTALKCTVTSMKKAMEGKLLLCDQEINLLVEYIHLSTPKKSVKDVSRWKFLEYENLITYIESSHWEDLQKAKVYPKLAYYMAKLLLECDTTENELRCGLELCHNAMELLRDTSRSFYLVEVAEVRCLLASRLLALDIEAAERIELEEMIRENTEWTDALKQLCEEHNLPVYMSDFCYLYMESECYNVVEVLEKRRTMLKLSRVKISNGICCDRTIVRAEREGKTPNIETLRELFERLGLCAEYRRAQMVTTDVVVLNKYYNELVRLVNHKEYTKALECVRDLKAKVDLSLPFNRQEIERAENYVLYQCRLIDADEFAKRVINTLGYTLDLSRLRMKKGYYFTRAELGCLHDLAFEVKSDVTEQCLKIIEHICLDAVKNGNGEGRLFPYEYILERMASQLGDQKRYEESTEMSSIILKECLKHHRIDKVAYLIYNKVWNYEQSRGKSTCDQAHISKDLQLCVCTSTLVKKYHAAAFFQKKKDLAI